MTVPVLPPLSRNRIKGSITPADLAPEGETADLGRMIELVLRRLRLVVIVCLSGAALSAFAGFVLMPSFTATALLAVPTTARSDARTDDSAALDTHITMLKSEGFLSRVAAALTKDKRLGSTAIRVADLEHHTNVTQELKSSLISVKETAKSPVAAAIIANAIAETYVDELTTGAAFSRSANIVAAQQRLEEIDARIKEAAARSADPATNEADRLSEQKTIAALRNERADLATDIELAPRQAAAQIRNEIISPAVRIVARAEPPQRRSSINPLLIVVPGTLLSLIAGVALALALSRFDPRLQTASDVAEYFGVLSLEIFGKGPATEKAASELTIALLSAFGAQQKRILVTSSHEADGKGLLVEEIARSAARLRPSVLVVDLESVSGGAEGAIYRASGSRFDRMNCASIFRDQSTPAPDLRLREMIAQASSSYEWIIVNAPPALQAPAIRLLTSWMSFGILAARGGATTKAQLGKALQMLTAGVFDGGLHAASGRFVVILTRTPETDTSRDAAPDRPRSAWRPSTKIKTEAPAVARSSASTASQSWE